MDTPTSFQSLKTRLMTSRWFDPAWMSFHAGEGTPNLGHFGLKSGPSFEAYTFYHELAHAMLAVLDDQAWRLDRYNYGLGYSTRVEVVGREYDEPVTDQAVHLELRVIALQLWLMQMDEGEWGKERLDQFLNFHVGSLTLMKDFLVLEGKLRRAGKIPSEGSIKEREKAAVAIMVEYCIAYAVAFRPDRVEALFRLCCEEAKTLKAQQASQSQENL